jgi:hypothetical protein
MTGYLTTQSSAAICDFTFLRFILSLQCPFLDTVMPVVALT